LEIAMRLVPLLVVLVTAACGGGKPGLKLSMIDASTRRPSNIAVYFTVETAGGEPVSGLTADSFRIFEDGQPVSALESKQTILNPEMAAAHHTLLLVDMSGSVSESGDVPVIVDAARAFAERVEKYQKVAVYAFDGAPEIHGLAGFSSGASARYGVDRLATFKARDPSTNLNGAIVEALRVLRRQMSSSSAPLTFGTLVVFTDGTDRAGRVPREKLHQELAAAEDLDVFVIGVGAEIDPGELQRIGRSGAILSKDRAAIASSFDTAAARVEAFSKRYYLLGYCTPARAGEHEVRIETTVRGKTGSLSYRFRADNFGPTCDPTQKPAFSLRRTAPREAPRENAPPPPPEGGGRF
jgi:hypothetical protein